MSQEIVKKLHTLIDELHNLVQTYHRESDDSKKFEILNKIIDIRSEIELLLVQLTRV